MSDSSDYLTEPDDESTVVDVEDLLRHSCDGSKVIFNCDEISGFYDGTVHEHDLILILNRYSDTYPNLQSIDIERGTNPDLVSTILLHFVRNHSHSMQSFDLGYCDVSVFFSHNNDFSNLTSHSNTTVPLNRAIAIKYCTILGNNAMRTVIENCSFFTSWDLTFIDHDGLIFILNALAQNVYIRSLEILCFPDVQGQEEEFVDSITKVVNRTKTLSKLEINFAGTRMFSKRAWNGLIDALINLEMVSGLSFTGMYFANVELLQKFICVFENNSNIRTLGLDSSLFHINGNFNASIFSNFLHAIIKNNCLRDFDFGFSSTNNGLQASQKMISFFSSVLKNSCIEKLTIRLFENLEGSLNKRILSDVIPFMGQLRYFHYSSLNEMSRGLQKIFFKSIGQCSRTLVEVKVQSENDMSAENRIGTSIKKFLERNMQLTACIKNKTKLCRSVWTKIIYISKPTGPDATFHFLCNLGHNSVGPDLSLFIPSIVANNNNNTITTTATEQCKRKFS